MERTCVPQCSIFHVYYHIMIGTPWQDENKRSIIQMEIGITGKCVLCNNQPETLEHLLFESYSKEV